MFIRITKSPNGINKRVYLVEAFRDKNGKQKQRILKRYGELGDLLKKDPYALEKLKKEAKNMTRENKAEINLKLIKDICHAKASVNYGYFYLERIYKDLDIENFLKNIFNKYAFKYNLNSILKSLVFSRILKPSSKLDTFKNQHKYFEPFDNKLVDMYRSLSVLNEIKDDLQVHIHKQILQEYNRDCTLVLYDVTNYYFEIEKPDELKKPGVSKENKKTPIVQMGLMIDKNKIPIGYKLFPGNTHDSKTAIPMINDLKNKFKIDKVIFTADKGINSAANLAYLVDKGDGYIVSQKIRGSSKEFINEVLNPDGYTFTNEEKSFKIKETFRTRWAKTPQGKDVELKEKVVMFWSKKYSEREECKREKLEDRITKFIKSPAALKASNSHGIKKYLQITPIDKDTGEVLKAKNEVTLNKKKYQRDKSLDGYYCLITSEVDKSAKEILDSYKELWKIEESFRIIKSDLEGRPVYVRRNDRIEGHFLTCFIALTILRILQYKLGFKYSASKIKNSLKESRCKEFGKSVYSMEPKNEIIHDLEKRYDAYIKYEISTLEILRKYKKAILHYKNK